MGAQLAGVTINGAAIGFFSFPTAVAVGLMGIGALVAMRSNQTVNDVLTDPGFYTSISDGSTEAYLASAYGLTLSDLGHRLLQGALGGDISEAISPTLRDRPDPMHKHPRLFWLPNADPLVLDLDGDGFEITLASQPTPVLFDADGDSIKTATSWIKSDDGLLVLDRNGNGTIDNGGELFGDQTIMTTGAEAGKRVDDGFTALADLDTNTDGVFNALDAQFGAVRIWRDTNADGISQPDELKTLIDSGVASITLASSASSTKYGDATLARAGSFTRSDGSVGEAGSFLLAQNHAVQSFAPITVSAAANALPAIGGAGWARALQEAATLNPNLVGLVQQAQNASTKAGFRDAVSNMLLAWGSESAYVSASDVALTHGYGVIESEPRNAQEEGWLDMAVKASTADRDAFRAGLGGDLLLCTRSSSTMTQHANNLTPAPRRARRASVPTGLRARGRGACGARSNGHQHHDGRAASVAAANWLRPTGTAARHAGGGYWRAKVSDRVQSALYMRLVGRNGLGGSVVASESPFTISGTQRAIPPIVLAHFVHCHLRKEEGHK